MFFSFVAFHASLHTFRRKISRFCDDIPLFIFVTCDLLLFCEPFPAIRQTTHQYPPCIGKGITFNYKGGMDLLGQNQQTDIGAVNY